MRSLAEMMAAHGDIFVGVRQRGVILGLEFDHPEGAVAVSRALYENGVWAIFSSLDTDGNGSINTNELSAAIQQQMDAGYRAYAQAAEYAA